MNSTYFWCLSASVLTMLSAGTLAAEGLPEDEEDTIVVTASPLARNASESLVGVSVLSGEDLARNQAATIGETLRREPGISETAFGAGASRPIIRGQGGDRIRILDNGIGSIDASSASPDHAVSVEPALAERIEIIRGAGLLRYGSSAAGGVINVIDGRIPKRVPENNIEGAIRVGTSSVDMGTEVAGGLSVRIGTIGGADIIAHGEGTWREDNDYAIPEFAHSDRLRAIELPEQTQPFVNGVVPNSYAEGKSWAAGFSAIGTNGFIGGSLKQNNLTYASPAEDSVFIVLDQRRYDMRTEWAVGTSIIDELNIFAGYADYKHTEFEDIGEPGTVFLNQGYEIRVEASQAPRGDFAGVNGIQIRRRDFSAIGDEAFVLPALTKQIGLYTFQEWRSGTTLVEISGRYENTTHEISQIGAQKEYDAFSVALSGHVDLQENLHLGATLSRTERAPTSEELYSNGPHLATGQFQLGDDDLDLEIGTGIEVILRTELYGGTLDFTAFYTDYQDYVFETATGLTNDGLPVFAFTPADAVFSGYEIVGDYDLGLLGGLDWSANATFDYVQARIDVTGNDNLPRIPPFGATLGLEGENNRLSFRFEAEHAGKQSDITAHEFPTDEFTLVNSYLTFTPFPEDDRISVSIAGLNLFDTEARTHTSLLKDIAPLPGRNIRVGVKLTF